MTGAIDTYVAGTKQLIEDAQRLGISWTLRPGTVSIIDPLKVTFDGDDTPVAAVSLIGVLAAGTRVMGLIIPPGGNFIIGFSDGSQFTTKLAFPVNYSAAGGVGTTASLTYSNIPNFPFVSVTKRFDATLTNISLIMTTGAFSTTTNTGVGWGINLHGGIGSDVDLSTGFINPASTHTYFAMTKLLTGLSAQEYSLVGRWKRTSGAGVLTTVAEDWTTILAEEVWAI